MNSQKSSLLFGGILILIGLFVLLSNLGVIFIESEIVVALFFLAGGAYFFYLFSGKKAVGHLIVASILTFIGLTVFLQTIPGFHDKFIAVLLFAGLAALFLFGFLRNTDNWGFLIPTGIFSTLALIVFIDTSRYIDDDIVGSIFFLGLGLTFGALYLIRNEENKLEWAREFGATDVINASKVEPVEAIKEMTGGNGVDYVFEAVGTIETLLQSIWSRAARRTST